MSSTYLGNLLYTNVDCSFLRNSFRIIAEVKFEQTQDIQDSIKSTTMDTTSSDVAHTLSRRGYEYAIGTKKILENVINNLWDPKDNPDGYVSLGVAENVQLCCN